MKGRPRRWAALELSSTNSGYGCPQYQPPLNKLPNIYHMEKSHGKNMEVQSVIGGLYWA